MAKLSFDGPNHPTANYVTKLHVNHRGYVEDKDDWHDHNVLVSVDLAKLAATYGPRACRSKAGRSRVAKGGITVKRLT